MFDPVDPKQSFPDMEENILAFWKQDKIFEKSLENRKDAEEFVFYDGPPFATGAPHYGHILQGTLKDVVPRYWTMKGKYVARRWGWDCHGLPIENIIEKQLGLNSKKDIEEEYGIENFNEACRKAVLDTSDEWQDIVDRMGRWIDFSEPYRTMDKNYMETVWWVFRQLWDKGLVYEGYKSMHVCPRCATPLSNFEVGLAYTDITDYSVTAQFKISSFQDRKNVYLLAWTTTPWTLPGNVAIAVGKDIEYVEISKETEQDSRHVILAKEIYENMLDTKHEFFIDTEIVRTYLGSDLIGLEYEPVFDYFTSADLEGKENMWKVYPADFVDTEQGTGIVHIASGYGEDDYHLSVKNGISVIAHVNIDGTFTSDVKDFAGEFVKPKDNPRKMDEKIAAYLREKGSLFEALNYKHSYPHCWRCDTPLLNYATSTWFVKVTDIREKMVESNSKVNWLPDFIGHGRFHNWLDNARDWAISRNRYWGAPLPIWRCEETGETLCIGSVDELEKLSGKSFDDIHKHYIDDVIIEKDGKTYKRIPEVFDCWFESGSMPYAQKHYPFENKAEFERQFPADFIAEGPDQTRGWFYTLTVLGNALFDVSPFKNVIVTGIILAEDGKKMSKRLKNYPDPNHIFDTYGADVMRLYLLSSPVVRADDLRFSEKGIDELLKKFFLPLWNSYSFFLTYARIDNFQPDQDFDYQSLEHSLDKWAVARLHETLQAVDENMQNYHLQKAVQVLLPFVEDMTNWYIRRSRRRFWKTEDDHDKNQAYQTLWYILKEFSKIIAPFTPFIAETIYKNLTGELSVHLSNFSEMNAALIEGADTNQVQVIQSIVSLGHKIRSQESIKVRQPLLSISVYVDKILSDADKDIICEELNIKEVQVVESPERLATSIIKPNAKLLGPRFGKKMQDIIREAKAGNGKWREDRSFEVLGEILSPEEITLHYQGKSDMPVAADKGIVVALNTELNDDLILEGQARDFVRLVQDLRKEADYHVADHITIAVSGKYETLIASNFEDYIKNETLADTITVNLDTHDIEKETLDGKVQLRKVS